jgi:hypothetical protein
MLEFVPDIQRLTQIFSQATAPTFFLGAVAAFVSLMSSRLSSAVTRIRRLNAISEGDPARAHLKTDLDRWRRRAALLNSGIVFSLISGIFSTALLAILFTTEFFGLKYAYGAGLLFILSTICLGVGLVRFAQEARLGLSEADEYE